MPFYRVQLRLACYAAQPYYKFSYNFRVESATVSGAANDVRDGWNAALRDAHGTAIAAYEVYATDENPDTPTFTTVTFQNDDRSGTSEIGAGGEVMPPWNVVRIEFPAGTGWPMVKYARFPLYESLVIQGAALTSAVESALYQGWTLFASQVAWVDEQGTGVSGPGAMTLTSKRLGKMAYTAIPLPPT